MDNDDQAEKADLFIDGTIGTITVDAWPPDGGGINGVRGDVQIPIRFSLIPMPDFVGALDGGGQLLFVKDDSGKRFPVSERLVKTENGKQVLFFDFDDEPGYMFKCFLLEAKNNHNTVRVFVDDAEESPDGLCFWGISRFTIL